VVPDADKKLSQAGKQANGNEPAVAQLQLDLAEALRSKGQFESRLKTAEDELEKLRSRTKADSRAIGDLTREKTHLSTKLRDREHELREKKRLLEVRATGPGVPPRAANPVRSKSRTR
jgi:hypothetical protein